VRESERCREGERCMWCVGAALEFVCVEAGGGLQRHQSDRRGQSRG